MNDLVAISVQSRYPNGVPLYFLNGESLNEVDAQNVNVVGYTLADDSFQVLICNETISVFYKKEEGKNHFIIYFHYNELDISERHIPFTAGIIKDANFKECVLKLQEASNQLGFSIPDIPDKYYKKIDRKINKRSKLFFYVAGIIIILLMMIFVVIFLIYGKNKNNTIC